MAEKIKENFESLSINPFYWFCLTERVFSTVLISLGRAA
jgi:hypothetical protein